MERCAWSSPLGHQLRKEEITRALKICQSLKYPSAGNERQWRRLGAVDKIKPCRESTENKIQINVALTSLTSGLGQVVCSLRQGYKTSEVNTHHR